MSVFPKLILWLNEMPMKSPNDFCFILCFLGNLEKLTLKCDHKGTITRTGKIILKKEKKVGNITLPYEKVCCIPH